MLKFSFFSQMVSVPFETRSHVFVSGGMEPHLERNEFGVELRVLGFVDCTRPAPRTPTPPTGTQEGIPRLQGVPSGQAFMGGLPVFQDFTPAE